MLTLAEISDKIALPHHALIGGIVLGCFCVLVTAFLALHGRRKAVVFLLVFAGLVLAYDIGVSPVDSDLAAAAESEIPGYHVRMHVSFLAPVSLAVVLSAMAARMIPDSLRRWSYAARNECVACGYSLDGLNSHRCPECGNELKAERPGSPRAYARGPERVLR